MDPLEFGKDGDDTRIAGYNPLLPPHCLLEEVERSAAAAKIVGLGRKEVQDVIEGRDDRLVVVVGYASSSASVIMV